jgi:hypothetical protein
MISAELLETFQQPPMRHEPDVGTVEPFTTAELDAIGRYNEVVGALEDCLDGAVISRDPFTELAAEHGRYAAIDHIQLHFGWLAEWFIELDRLDAGLRDGAGHLSNAADRAVAHELGRLFWFRERVRSAALRCLAGPACDVAGIGPGGYVMLSNGLVQLDLGCWS